MVLLDSLLDLAQQYAGKTVSAPVPLKGDGSDRQIYRFQEGEKTWVGVTNLNIAENQAFFFLSKHLIQCGIPVPQVYLSNQQQDCYLLEDLGNDTLADLLQQWKQGIPIKRRAILKAYQKVLHWLPKIQIQGHQGLDYTFCFREATLDLSVFQADIEYFKNYFWKLFAESYPFYDAVMQELEELTVQLSKVERGALVLRDFQPRNIMWRHEEPYFIDYQMGCQGAVHYDLASLLYASASGLNEELRDLLINVYLQELQPCLSFSKVQFLKDFYCFVLIRRLRSLGTYGFLSSQKGKLYFLEAIPATIQEIYGLLESKPSLQSFFHLKAMFHDWKQNDNLCQISSLYDKIRGPQ